MWTENAAAQPRRSAPDDRRRVQQTAPSPTGKHGRKAKVNYTLRIAPPFRYSVPF